MRSPPGGSRRRPQTSTMAVYTHFGGMPALVKEIVAEGFTRLDAHQAAVPHTDDPVADLHDLAMAYRENALAEPAPVRRDVRRHLAQGVPADRRTTWRSA